MISASARLSRLPVEERGLTIGDFLVPIRVSERMNNLKFDIIATNLSKEQEDQLREMFAQA